MPDPCRLGVVALGDSITNGAGGIALGVPPRSWALWLATALELPFTAFARDGALTREVIAEQLPRVARDYDVAALYTGVNDVRGMDWDERAYDRDLRTLLAALGERAERVVVLTAPLDLGRPRAGAKVAHMNARIRAAAEEAGAIVGELEDLRGARFVLPDAVHPTALGQVEIASRAVEALRAAGAAVSHDPWALAAPDGAPLARAEYALGWTRMLARDLRRRAVERVRYELTGSV